MMPSYSSLSSHLTAQCNAAQHSPFMWGYWGVTMLHLIWIICLWHHNPVWKISKIMFAWILSEQLAKSCSLWYFATSPDLYPNHLHGIMRPNSITVSAPPLSRRDPPKTCCPWIVGVKLVSCLLGWHLYHLSVKNPSSLIAFPATGPVAYKRTAFFVNLLDRSRGKMVNKIGHVIPCKWFG